MLIKMSREGAKDAKGGEGKKSLALVSFAYFAAVAGHILAGPKGLSLQPVDDARDSVFQVRDVEVDKETELEWDETDIVVGDLFEQGRDGLN